MSTVLSRRMFICKLGADDGPTVRPPWSAKEAQFLKRCTRCGECVSRCTAGIIISDRNDFPQIDFNRGACTFCGDCVKACTPGALHHTDLDPPAAPWSLDLAFTADCLEYQHVTCRVCSDGCEQAAIRFRRDDERRFAPDLDASRCNGCGYCRSVCPVDAISIKPSAELE